VIRAALVLGAAVWPGGRPSPTLRRRADHALGLFRAGKVQILVASGGLGAHPPTEAQVMADLWRAAGVPLAAIRQEDRSTTTRENVTFSLPLFWANGVTQVVIVTDPYHAPRARLIAQQLGLRATTDTPPWSAVGPRQWARHAPREAFALLAALLRWR